MCQALLCYLCQGKASEGNKESPVLRFQFGAAWMVQSRGCKTEKTKERDEKAREKETERQRKEREKGEKERLIETETHRQTFFRK